MIYFSRRRIFLPAFIVKNFALKLLFGHEAITMSISDESVRRKLKDAAKETVKKKSSKVFTTHAKSSLEAICYRGSQD
jgi:hypothetical protein